MLARGVTHDRILPLFCSVGGGGFCSRGEAFSSHDRLLPLFCSMGGEASTHEGKQRRLLRARQNSPPLLRGGRGFSSRGRLLSGETKAPSQSATEFSPSFAVWGGRLLLARGGNQGAFSRHQGKGAQEHNNQLIFSGIILSTSTVSTFTNSSNMDTDLATTPGNNTEDALVESSPIGAQAAPDDDDVQIVPPSPAAATASNHKKRKKSNDCDDQQSKQKKQRKLPATSKKRQKPPPPKNVDRHISEYVDRLRYSLK